MQSMRQVQTGRQLQPGRLPSARAPRSNRLNCHASVVWRQLDGTKAWVAHPRSARTKGVIHFLGGAFAGAAPQLLYNAFIEKLADAGYTTIATPYKVTFKHDACARQVRQAFLDSLTELRNTGRSYLTPPKAPLFAVGHSNGALLHLLINSFEPGAADASIIISYNNLQVSDAIPIPGFLDTLQPTVQAARASANSSLTSSQETRNITNADSSSSSSGNPRSSSSSMPSSVEQQLLAAAAASIPLSEQQQLLLSGASPALEQLSSIVNEVGDGTTDFVPSPEDSRAIVAAGYACPATLLVQFENDSFDETPEMQQLLTARLVSSSSSSGTDSTSPVSRAATGSATALEGTVANTAAAAAAAAATLDEPASGSISAWSSIDEDLSMDALLQQLQELQASLTQQEQQQLPGTPLLQQLLLPGSHITPCGAQLQPLPGLSPFDALLDITTQQGSQAELQNLADKVLAWLEGCRARAVQRRAVMMQAPAAAAAGTLPISVQAGAGAAGKTGAAGAAAGLSSLQV